MTFENVKRIAEEERFKYEKTREQEDNDFALDIIGFANLHGFTVYSAELNDVSGVVLISQNELEGFEGEKKVIVVDAKDSALRQRFTIAHELAHYFLHLNEDQKNCVAYRDDKRVPKSAKEQEADYFASNLLMPENKVRAAIRAFAPTLGSRSVIGSRSVFEKTIQFISNIFLVSPSASKVRLKQLNLIP